MLYDHRFGPLVHQWTMRYEAKHKYFKTLASSIGNFINIPYTLAMRHQYLQCYLHLDNQSENQPVFTKGKYIGPRLCKTLLTQVLTCQLLNFPTWAILYRVDQFSSGTNNYCSLVKAILSNSSLAYSTKSVEVNGVTYKIGVVLATKPATGFEEEPSFGQIKEIYVVESSVYFYLQALDTLEYSQHYCTYITATTLTFSLVKLQSIASYLPLSPYSLSKFPGRLCLAPKFIFRWNIFLIMHTITMNHVMRACSCTALYTLLWLLRKGCGQLATAHARLSLQCWNKINHYTAMSMNSSCKWPWTPPVWDANRAGREAADYKDNKHHACVYQV